MLLHLLWLLFLGHLFVDASTPLAVEAVAPTPVVVESLEIEPAPIEIATPNEPQAQESQTKEPTEPSPAPTPTTPTVVQQESSCGYFTPPKDSNYTQAEWCELVRWEQAHPMHSSSDYLKYYAGVCPSAQDAPAEYVRAWGWGAALNLNSPYPSAEYWLEQAWQGARRDHALTGQTRLGSLENLQLPTRDRYTYLTIDWDSLTVFWSADYGGANSAWNRLAGQMTDYLRGLETQFNSRCPNE